MTCRAAALTAAPASRAASRCCRAPSAYVGRILAAGTAVVKAVPGALAPLVSTTTIQGEKRRRGPVGACLPRQGRGVSLSSCTLAIRVQAGAGRSQVTGYADGVLRVKIAAPAVEGKANQALLAYLARLLEVRPWQVAIVKGARSRAKVVRVEGLEQPELEARLRGLGQ
ncbi:MAG: DUF167 domain-containing protein [Chloroflexi bacterium]|nr:DUF167 domain-containing protein [Chloroflexota bacterium]